MVGSLTAGIYISLFTLLLKALNGNYQIAVSISYVVAVVLHFTANRKFTFKSRTNMLSQQLPRYLIMLVINYFITLTFMHVAIEVCHLPPYLGIVFTICATGVLNFLIYKFWIFQAVKTQCFIK